MDITVYTDGSYRPSTDTGAIGIVWLNGDKKLNEFSKGFKQTSNNKMELLAIYYALVAIKKPINSLTIISDSEYALGCIFNEKWNPKKNISLITKIKQQLKTTQSLVKEKIIYKHTYGHSNDKWNNYVDNLAQKESSYEK